MSPSIRVSGMIDGQESGKEKKGKRKIIKKKIGLHSGTLIAVSEFEEVKRHREVRDA